MLLAILSASLFPSPFPQPAGSARQGHVQPLQEQIEQAIRLTLESTVQRQDFGLASEGARVFTELTTHLDTPGTSTFNSPDKVLTEDLRRESCWRFPGEHGQLGIRLFNQLITPTHVALDAAMRTAFYTRAPRHVILWGVVDGDVNRRIYDTQLRDYRTTVAHLGDGPAQSLGYTFLALVDFEYNPIVPFPLQTHAIARSVVLSQITFGILVLEVRSNWRGSSTYLCRIRIHGDKRQY
ncbi:hypothetical protein C8Q79DRAFT_913599 [Trametes meyenii]|nr:hypothetical protein C8Q79DRAFT_913599 [Trametes meyenii]